MQLKGCGYRWVVKQRRKAQERKEQEQKAMLEFQELRQRILGEIIPEGLKKKVLTQARAQSNSEAMKFRQQPQHNQPQDNFAYEVTHNFGPPGLWAGNNSKSMRNS